MSAHDGSYLAVSRGSAPDHAIAYTGPAISHQIHTWGLVRDGAHGTVMMRRTDKSRVVGSFAYDLLGQMHVPARDAPCGPRRLSMALAGPLVQLVLDYFDEEQCRSSATYSDDAALQLMDDAYSSELRPPAYVMPLSQPACCCGAFCA